MSLFRVAQSLAVVACAGLAIPAVSSARPIHAQPLEAGPRVHHAARAQSTPHLYVLLGLANASPGLAEFGEDMQRRGIRTVVANHSDEEALARDAIAEFQSGRADAIEIIGHSLGGSAAAHMAAELGQAGVPVKLLVTLDPVGDAEPTANVKRYANFVPRSGEDHFTMIAGRLPDLYAFVLGR